MKMSSFHAPGFSYTKILIIRLCTCYIRNY